MAERIASPDVSPEQCRDFAETHFSVGRMANAYLDLYTRALAEPGACARRESEWTT
jgi:hypothetical protein